MKNQNLIGAVMMVSLSFTACQKEDVLAPRPSATSQTARMINHQQTIAKQFPLRVRDLVTLKVKEFAYDDAKRLVKLQADGKSMAFAYDRSGRVAKIAITDSRDSRTGNKILVMNYSGDADKPFSIVEEPAVASAADRFMKTTVIKYDRMMNKVSELEIAADHSILLSRLFTYDSKGNCIEFRELKDGLVVKQTRFADFDEQPSLMANLQVLALLPGAIFQKSNAQTVTELMNAAVVADPIDHLASDILAVSTAKLIQGGQGTGLVAKTTHYKFIYNNFHFPIEVIQIASDFEQVVQKIEYMTNQW